MHVLLMLALLLGSAAAAALEFRMPPPGEDIIGAPVVVKIAKYTDTLDEYAEAYGVGFREIVAANPGVNPWVPGEGRSIVVPVEFILPPGERNGVVINLAEQRLYYYHPDGQTVETFALGIGREGWETPLGATKITGVIKNPTWVPPASIRAEHAAAGDPLPAIVPPGPDNPLGKWAIRLSIPSYFIHGTNKKMGVGMRVSHGCMRMYNGDVDHFAQRVKIGTPVRIINTPVKVGWKEGELYVEVHEALEEQRAAHVPEAAVADAIHIANRVIGAPVEVDWHQAKAAAVTRTGLPVRVSAAPVIATR